MKKRIILLALFFAINVEATVKPTKKVLEESAYRKELARFTSEQLQHQLNLDKKEFEKHKKIAQEFLAKKKIVQAKLKKAFWPGTKKKLKKEISDITRNIPKTSKQINLYINRIEFIKQLLKQKGVTAAPPAVPAKPKKPVLAKTIKITTTKIKMPKKPKVATPKLTPAEQRRAERLKKIRALRQAQDKRKKKEIDATAAKKRAERERRSRERAEQLEKLRRERAARTLQPAKKEEPLLAPPPPKPKPAPKKTTKPKREDLLGQIRKGVTLKPTPKVSPKPKTGREGLLEQIRKGVTLKHVTEEEKKKIAEERKKGATEREQEMKKKGHLAQMAKEIEKRRAALLESLPEETPDSDDTGWED